MVCGGGQKPNLAIHQGPRIKSSAFSSVHLKRTRDRAKDGMEIRGNPSRTEVPHGKASPPFARSHRPILRQVA